MVQLTDRAAHALVRSLAAARRFDPRTTIRLAPAGSAGVRAELSDGPQEGDRSLELPDGTAISADPALVGTVDLGDHDAYVLIPEP